MLDSDNNFLTQDALNMPLSTAKKAIWESAEMLIAFHKNKQKERRDSPFLWRPKAPQVRIQETTEDQEAIVLVKSAGDAEDVIIKLESDQINLHRNHPLGWSCIAVGDDFVTVTVDNAKIRIGPDGTVKVERDAETTYLEGDGAIIKITPHSEILVSNDGDNISRRTADQVDAITADGILSKKR